MKPRSSSWEDCFDRMYLYLMMCVGRMQVAFYRLVIALCCSLEPPATRPHARPHSNRSETSATVRDVTTTPRLSGQIISPALQDTDSHRTGRPAGYIGRMITSPPVHKEKIYSNCLTLMTKENLPVSLKVAVEAAVFIFQQWPVRLNKGQSGHTAKHIS